MLLITRMKIALPLLLLASLMFAACGEKPAPPPAAKKPAAPAAQKLTSGNVAIVGMGDRVEPVLEVIIVGSVPNKVYEMITKQQTALDAMINPKQTETAPASQIMSPADHERITKGIEALQREFPEQTTMHIFGESALLGETIPYVSRESLHQKYQQMFNRLRIENLIDGLNAIVAKMKEDHATLVELSKQDGEGGRQATADIKFMSVLSTHLQEYQNVVDHYDEARRKELLRQNQEQNAIAQMATPEETWTRTQNEVSYPIQQELYKSATGTAYAEQDGSFKAPGHGKIIVRAIMNGESVFFVHEGPGDDFIDVTDLRSQVIEPGAEGAAAP